MFNLEQRFTGRVTYFNVKKGSGFIRPDLEGFDKDIFISYTEIEPDKKEFKTLLIGDKVSFSIKTNNKGYVAVNLKLHKGE